MGILQNLGRGAFFIKLTQCVLKYTLAATLKMMHENSAQNLITFNRAQIY